ncbi:MAG: HAMP domain-containing histidine kinase [Opitutae bacterium]|nr:HAMP domain-containing histidine kinase [Opitutae bacterium]MBT5691354.1 HAMP domain-containing histidine kinase [Opitutae bacterium]
MRPRLAIIYLLLVLMPLGLLAWLGTKLAREEKARVRDSLQQVMQQRLADIDGTIVRLMEDLESELLRATDFTPADAPQVLQQQVRIIQPTYNTHQLRTLAGKHRFVRQFFVIAANNRFLHPPTGRPEQTDQEKRFYERTLSVWESGERFYESTDDAWSTGPNHGWHTWFWGEGVNLLFWKRTPGGQTLGAEIEVAALQAELIARLPDQTSHSRHARNQDTRIRLLDASAHTLYQWGNHEPVQSQTAEAEIAVAPPFSMWTLQYFASLPAGSSSLLPINLTVSLLALGSALLLLALYFYKENTRELRTANQRVTFVNQVSHELKTPLTNIRMYAEMLEDQFPEEEQKPRNYLKVITDESRRLSRLIGNVLTFAQSKRQELRIHRTPSVPDETISSTLEHFCPALESRGFQIHLDLNASHSQSIDPDLLEQILGNLISNVEKYAATGKYLGITSSQSETTLKITVQDHGPGIPPNQYETIFQPFQRISNQLSDGVSGTGIGLSIARDLARHHGGDLVLQATETGAEFKLTICS